MNSMRMQVMGSKTKALWKTKMMYGGLQPCMHQEKSRLLMSAKIFTVIPPTKFGRLGLLLLPEVSTWLPEVRFCALPTTFHRFQHFESDRGFP